MTDVVAEDSVERELGQARESATARKRARTWKQVSAKWIRWTHIYVSMFSCAVVLFFSATGITLNHPTWFGGDHETVRETSGTVNLAWVAADSNATSNDVVARLEIVEHLRSESKVHGAMKEFTVDESQCIVAFRAPGYSADAFIDRETGKYDLVESSLGWIAIFNDLHKGRDSGIAWSWVIDISAAFLVFVSISGLLLLLYINRHRKTGLLTGLGGLAVTVVIYLALVPR